MSVSGDYLSVPLCCVVCVGGGGGDVVRGGGGGGGGGGGSGGVSIHTSVSFFKPAFWSSSLYRACSVL